MFVMVLAIDTPNPAAYPPALAGIAKIYGAFPGGIDACSTRPRTVTIRYFPSCAEMELNLRLFSETRLWPNMRELFSAVVDNVPHGETTGEGKCED